MRVTVPSTLALALALALSSGVAPARAQVVIGGAPVAPTSWAEASVSAAYLSTEGLDGTTAGMGLRGAFAPIPLAEIGASLGIAGTWLGAEGAVRRSRRIGLAPIGLSLGIGARLQNFSTGARMFVELAPRALGLDGVDSGGTRVSGGARIDTAVITPYFQVRTALSAGALGGDSEGTASFAGALLFETMFGHYGLRLRPFARFAVRLATDLPVSGELGIGAVIRLVPRWLLRVAVTASDRSDPSAERVRGELALVFVPPR